MANYFAGTMRITDQVFLGACEFVLGADRAIRTKLSHFPGVADVLMNLAADLNWLAERSFGVGCPRVEQDAVPDYPAKRGSGKRVHRRRLRRNLKRH